MAPEGTENTRRNQPQESLRRTQERHEGRLPRTRRILVAELLDERKPMHWERSVETHALVDHLVETETMPRRMMACRNDTWRSFTRAQMKSLRLVASRDTDSTRFGGVQLEQKNTARTSRIRIGRSSEQAVPTRRRFVGNCTGTRATPHDRQEDHRRPPCVARHRTHPERTTWFNVSENSL